MKGVVVVRLPTTGVVWSQPVARGYTAAARWPADVVYVHRPHPLADHAVLRGPDRPTIVLHHADVQRQRIAKWLYRPLARSVARRAAACIVATKSHLDHAEDLGVEGREKAQIIPFGVDVAQFKPKNVERPRSFPNPEEGPVGLFVGRLVGYKGLDVLVRAVAGSRHRIVIVGDGPMREPIEREIHRAGLRTQVFLVGSPTNKELVDYYRSADYFVLPSTTPAEMFGITILEAMACALPVVSTALGTGVEEVNAADETGIVVPPRDVEGLRTALDRLAGDAALRARMGTAGRARVERQYSLDRMIDRHLALCEKVAGRQ